MKKILFSFGLLAATLAATLPSQAASLESYAGKTPQGLLKIAAFASAYRAAASEIELPAWTRRLGAGPAAEIVDIGGGKRVLTSACSKNGCQDERIYILFDPATKSASGFFFLPSAADEPGDSRTAFSQWFGQPAKEASDFLLERAATDAHSLNQPSH